MAMVDALKLAEYLAAVQETQVTLEAATKLDQAIVKRGRKAVLESRNAADQFHTMSKVKQFNRNLGFKIANVVIKLFSRAK